MNRTFHIQTMGCQMNEHDSEIMAGMLVEAGFSPVDDIEKAGVALINTCSIRDNADKRFFGTLGQLKKKKEKDKNFIVCVCGCMMQQQHIIDEIKKRYSWVDIIFGTHTIADLPKLIDNSMKEKLKQVDVLDDTDYIPENLPCQRVFKSKALVNVTFGCNNFCTYCIVPYTRGREKSREPEAIIEEVKALVKDGVKEITLLGQNVNSYRTSGNFDFPDLIYKLNDLEGLERIRFMTSHPKDMSDKLIKAFVDCDKLCKYIHLPIQSGSSAVLKKMNRRYDREQYLTLAKKIKAAVPNITISTDIIVGFPGETEEDFQDTLNMVREVEYDSVFTFLYSIRKGTPAEKYEDQIPEDIKHERFNRLVEVVNEISEKKNLAYEGHIEKVLVEGRSKNNKETLSGRTDGWKLVNFIGDDSLIGQIVNVEITKAHSFNLEGKLI